METSTLYNTRPTTETWILVYIIGVTGLLCIFAPDKWIMTPAHAAFFGFINATAWGVLSVVVAVLLALPSTALKLLRHMFATFICVMWAGVAFWPSLDGQTWNAISSTIWTGVAVLAIVQSGTVARRA